MVSNGIFMYNEAVKEKYLKDFENPNTREVYQRLFQKSKPMEESLGKDLHDFSEQEWDTYFEKVLRPKTKESARTYSNVLSNYVQWAIESAYSKVLSNPLRRGPDYFYKFVQDKKAYMTFEEKEAITSTLINSQDAFPVEALWNGIQGKKLSELVNLTIDDIDHKNNEIIIRDEEGKVSRVLKFDEKNSSVIELAILANKEEEYYRMNGLADVVENFKDKLPLPKSKYILKIAQTKGKEVDNTDEKISIYTIYNRLDMIRDLEEFDELRDALTTKNIVRSGMIYMALQLYERYRELDRKQIEEICARYGMKYKWALKDFLNVEMLRDLYPYEMENIERKSTAN